VFVNIVGLYCYLRLCCRYDTCLVLGDMCKLNSFNGSEGGLLHIQEKLIEMIEITSEWRGVQEGVIQVILDGVSWILVVISIGGSKSLLFIMPTWLQIYRVY
jgi:superfamily II DNA helicase RecQ